MFSLTRIMGAFVALTILTGAASAAPTDSPVEAAVIETVDAVEPVKGGEDNGSIDRLYYAFFGREADAGGRAHWQRTRNSGVSLADIASAFARSREFNNRYGALADRDFVHLVYRNVLGRNAEPAGHAHWVDQLRRGMTRGRLMIGFSDSVEFKMQRNRRAAEAANAGTPTTGKYGFTRTNRDGSPYQWAPCTPIRVQANFTGANLAEAEQVLIEALTELSAATKTQWTYIGQTTRRSKSATRTRDFEGEQWTNGHAPVLVSWPATWDAQASIAAYGGYSAIAERDGKSAEIVSGVIALNSANNANSNRSRFKNVLLHELGHVANLAHVDDITQTMYGKVSGHSSYQSGDRAGLAKLGSWNISC